MSAGSTARPSGVEAASASKSAGDWSGLASTGPGPMALTRMRGASSIAIIRVADQRAALERV